jgi:uncharacterized membrane protein
MANVLGIPPMLFVAALADRIGIPPVTMIVGLSLLLLAVWAVWWSARHHPVIPQDELAELHETA